MNLKQAITYPLRKENRLPVLGMVSLFQFAGLVAFGATVAGFIIALPLLHPELATTGFDPTRASGAFSGEIYGLVSAAVCFGLLAWAVFSAPAYGYLWELAYTLQTRGLDAPPPAWRGNFKNYLNAGMHLVVANLVLGIPLAIVMTLSLGLVTPFYITAFLASSREKTSVSFIKALLSGVPQTMPLYVPLLLATLAGSVLAMAYQFACSVLIITSILSPLVTTAASLTMLYLVIEQTGGRFVGGASSSKASAGIPGLEGLVRQAESLGTANISGYEADYGTDAPALTENEGPATDAPYTFISTAPEYAGQNHNETISKFGALGDQLNNESAALQQGGSLSPGAGNYDETGEMPIPGNTPSPSLGKKKPVSYNFPTGDNPWLRQR